MVGNSVLVMTEKVFDLALRLVQVRMAHFHMTHEPYLYFKANSFS